MDKVGKNSVDLSWTPPRNDGGSKVRGNLKYKNWKNLVIAPNELLMI